MRKVVVVNCAVLMLVAELAPAAPMVRGRYVPNEIIVKFHRNVADTAKTKLSETASCSELELSASLDRLNRKYRLRKCRPLFKNFKKRKAHSQKVEACSQKGNSSGARQDIQDSRRA